jgi:catechol 2,3-dioxygenase-like lactoylglutathione lyase family enzyme
MATFPVAMRIDHVGIVVADLDAAIDWYSSALGMREVWRQPLHSATGSALALPQSEAVRLMGAMLEAGEVGLELHQYVNPSGVATRHVYDTGIGHIAVASADLEQEIKRLKRHGMHFDAPAQRIADGPLAGRCWVYGRDPWDNVIELCQHPSPKE